MEKLLNVLGDNLGYTIVAIVAIIAFALSSEGHLIYGLITAFSAVIAYTCIVALYNEYKKAGTTGKKTTKKSK